MSPRLDNLHCFIVLITLLPFLPIVTAAKSCYYPNNTSPATEDQPCNASATDSMCCGTGDICLSNGLCYAASLNAVQRGSCTDQSWHSSACTQLCLNTSSAASIYACPGSTTDFYCGNKPSACVSAFQLPAGYFADSRNASTGTSSSAAGAFPWGSGPPPWITAGWASSASGGSPTSAAAGAPQTKAATTTVVATVSATSSTEPPSKGPSSVAIGAGVGVPLGVAVVGALLLLFRMVRRKDRQRGLGYGTEKRAEMDGIPPPPPQETAAREVFEAPGSMDVRGPQVKIVEPA